jgi:hypothetical protein
MIRMGHLSASGHYDVIVIGAECIRMGTKVLTNLPLHAVSFDRASPSFESDPHPEMSGLVGNTENSTFRKP